MEVALSLDGSEPLYRQVYRGLRDAILEGRLSPGERVPATRRLADRLDVSRTVVLEAYRQLRMEGYVTAERGSGTYVADVLPEDMLSVRPDDTGGEQAGPAVAPLPGAAVERLRNDPFPPDWRASGRPPPEFDFTPGSLRDGDFPHTTWRRLLTHHLRAGLPRYGPVEGHPGLREAVTAYVRRARAVQCDVDQVVVTDGARPAFDVLFRALLRPGDPVVVEEPHYADARHQLVAAGAEPVGVPVDDDGLIVDELPRDGSRVRLAYLTPSHQFPAGGVLPMSRRAALLAWAQEHDVYLVEDDYDAEFQYEARPVESLQALDREGRVVYVGTFSKVLSPDLRLGYVVLPPAMKDLFMEAKWLVSRQSPTAPQAALAEFMRTGAFDRHVRRMRNRHEERRKTLLDALEANLGQRAEVVGSRAGVHVLVRLPGRGRGDLPGIVRRAEEAGVRVYGADEHYLDPPDRAELLLGYAAHEPEEIREGVARLASAVEETDGSDPPGQRPDPSRPRPDPSGPRP